MNKLANRGKVVIGVLVIIVIALFFLLRPHKMIEFNEISNKIEINSVVDYHKFIKEIKSDKKEKLVIDDSKVQYNKLGEYDVIFKIGDKEEILTIEIVDTIKPKVKLKTLDIRYNYPLKAEELIDKIEDSTKTEVSFLENYSFDKVGKQEVSLSIKDEAGNITEAKTTVNVLEKDEEKPIIHTKEIEIAVNSKKTLADYIEVSDNQDKDVKIKVDEKNLNRQKVGDYKVKVTACDASSNQSEAEITVHVKKSVSQKVVYLTFDDGPSRYTSSVLNILKKYNIKATFFVTGINKKYYSRMKDIVNGGHTIALHTYSHDYGKVYQSVDAYFNDLEKISNLVEKQTGKKTKYIRFPGGSSNTVSRKYSPKIMSKLVGMVEKKGYRYFDWNCENGDGYSRMATSEMIRRATSSKQKQVMILMHDANGKQATVDTLSTIIEYYKNKGYEFKGIDEDTPDFHQNVNN